jgi:hypothetical protein
MEACHQLSSSSALYEGELQSSCSQLAVASNVERLRTNLCVWIHKFAAMNSGCVYVKISNFVAVQFCQLNIPLIFLFREMFVRM